MLLVSGTLVVLAACDARPVRAGSAVADPPAQAAAASPAPSPADSGLGFPVLPDPVRTPGDTLAVTAADVCTPGYARRVRDVPAAVKREVYVRYGITHHAPRSYEVDHLISLELGGSNSVRNLWPESYRTHPWNARVKDALENALHRRVCAGQMTLHDAQRAIAANWVAAYRRYVHAEPPAAPGATRRRHR